MQAILEVNSKNEEHSFDLNETNHRVDEVCSHVSLLNLWNLNIEFYLQAMVVDLISCTTIRSYIICNITNPFRFSFFSM